MQKRRVILTTVVVVFSQLLVPLAASAAPQPPVTVLPEFVRASYHESFDEVYWAGMTNAEVIIPNYGRLRESWSGYALQRSGVVPPLIISGLSETGRVQVATGNAALRFWFRPYWASGSGPGAVVQLAELAAVEGAHAAVLWSLQVTADGSELQLVGPNGSEALLGAEIAWAADSWHQVLLNYGTNGTELMLDGESVINGDGTLAVPESVARLAIGSSMSGEMSAGGEFEEVFCFARPLKVAFYLPFQGIAALGPMSEAEMAYRLELMAKWKALAAAKAKAAAESGGGETMQFASSGPSAVCITNGPVFLTNVVCFFTTNSGWTLAFDVAGGTNGVPYDLYSTTNLIGNHITNSAWSWTDSNLFSCFNYVFTNQPTNQSFFLLGTTNDTDADLLTDAYELLVSKTLVNTNDTDADGMPDGWEVHNGLNPLDPADASDDPDGDWLTNLQEYNGGTNSTNPQDVMVVAWGDNSDGQCNVPLNLREVKAIAAGDNFSLALRNDGTVVGWGANDVGQTNVPTDLTNAVAIDAKFRHAAAVRTNGTISMWGVWWHGSDYSLYQPADLTNVVSIATGASHDLALRSDGTLTTWSTFSSTPFTTIPTNVVSPKSIAAGYSHSVAALGNGTVTAWGENLSSLGWNVTNVPAGLSNVTSVVAGDYHTLALKADGRVVAWGAGNGSGILFEFGQSIVPSWLSNVTAVAAAGFHSMALRTDGSVVSWGDMPSPANLQSNVIAIATGLEHGLGIRTGRQLPFILQPPANAYAPSGSNVTFKAQGLGLAEVKYQWQFNGVNLTGQTNATLTVTNISAGNVGNYTVVFSTGAGAITSSVATLTLVGPPQIVSVSPPLASFVWVTSDTNLTVIATAPGTNVFPLHYQWRRNGVVLANQTSSQHLFAGSLDAEYSVTVTNAAGSTNVGNWQVRALLPGMVAGWGTNSDGQADRPVDLTNTVSLSAGKYHSVAAREDGGVKYWGYSWGSLPTDLTNIVSVSAGYAHTLALRNDGTVTSWGLSSADANTVPTNNFGVKAVAAGVFHNVALITNGTVAAWGTNAGNLTQVPANLTNATAVAAGYYHSLVLKSDGTVVSWGYSESGQTNVPTGLSNVVAIAAGWRHSLALKSDGTVTAWGQNGAGQCYVPAGLSNVLAIAAGWEHSAALKNDGTVVCWGANGGGQTNVPANVTPVKLIAAGGDHTLVSVFSPLVQYQVDVTKDLLLIYNAASTNSIWVKEYYLAHRPMVSGANTLGISCATNELISNADFTNQVQTPYLNWLNANPTKRPQYLIWFHDLPRRAGDGGVTIFPSPSYRLHTAAPGIPPFVTCINMRTTNDCKAYIDKLESFSTNSPSKLFISASKGGYSNTNFIVDSIRHGFGHLDNYTGEATVSVATNGLLSAGVAQSSILFADGSETITNGVHYNLAHITAATNVAGYISWGFHSSLHTDYAVNNVVRWSGDSAWWIIETIESYNGVDTPESGNYLLWYSTNAFGGTNYSNTPVGAVTHVEEPSLSGVNKADIYFGLWAQGKCFGIVAWASWNQNMFYPQVIGDPFVTR